MSSDPMSSDQDRYDDWYARKLWELLPAIYRAEDSPDFDRAGPLRELVVRIAAQAAIVRRSVDRLWEDQSIETCDDWVIAYLGDLLATNLVASLDARGQRIDVAKTIYYRRRKGTVGLLEELATDITGWGVRVVEFFRRLARTRHGLDPAIGLVALPRFTAVAHVGTSTGTLLLGGAPLEDHDVTVIIGASGQAGAATWSTTLDGAPHAQGAAAAVTLETPGGGTIAITLVDGGVAPSFVAGDTFSFRVTTDPRGRLQRAEGLVGAITRTGAGGLADLRNAHGATRTRSAFDEYFHTADVRRGRGATGWHDIPRLGVFAWRLHSLGVRLVTPVMHAVCANHYTFDPTGRDVPLFAAGERPIGDQWLSPQEHQLPAPITRDLIRVALSELYRDGDDRHSLAVYIKPGPPSQVPPVLIARDDLASDARATAGKPWIDAERGRVILPAASTDPLLVDYHHGFSSEIGAGAYDRGTLLTPADALHVVDGVAIAAPPPAAAVATPVTVVIDDSLTYPTVADVLHAGTLVFRARNQQRPLLRLPTGKPWTITGDPGAALTLDGLFVSGADVILAGAFDRVTISCCTLDPGTWDPDKLDVNKLPAPGWAVSADGRDLIPTRLRIQGSIRELVIDRSILGPITGELSGRVETMTVRDTIVQAADPKQADAIARTNGVVALSRTTVLGTAKVHRFDASECILDDVVTVDDTQHGCVRFTAWADGSTLPRQYESVKVPAGAALFTTIAFGQPAYAQLADRTDGAISEGAEDGSEMGAFWRERNAIKERSLLIKYQEYLPLGLEPVVVHAT